MPTSWRPRASYPGHARDGVAAAVAAAGVAAAAAEAASSAKSELRGLRRASCPPPTKPLKNPHAIRSDEVEDARQRHLFPVGPYSG